MTLREELEVMLEILMAAKVIELKEKDKKTIVHAMMGMLVNRIYGNG